jgi:hypothetical protein
LVQPKRHFWTFINVRNGLPEDFPEIGIPAKAKWVPLVDPTIIYHPKAPGSLYSSNHTDTGSTITNLGHKVPTLLKKPMQDPLQHEAWVNFRHLQMKGRSLTVFWTFAIIGNEPGGVFSDVNK